MPVLDDERIGEQHQCLWRVRVDGVERAVQLTAAGRRKEGNLDAELPCLGLGIGFLELLTGMQGMGNDSDALEVRCDVSQQL